jgi:dihydrofolate synthase/folylpolyglutamate synthase
MLFEDYFKHKGEFQNLELTLERIEKALKKIDFDESKLGKIIHIAGTNGKGSTAYFLSQMFQNAGFKAGLFTSPHLFHITERIKINNESISIENFDNIFDKYIDIIENFNLSYFEALTFICFKYFSLQNIDIAIIETGMGGKYDSTNVLNKKIPVITRISSDHEIYLGKNIYGIIDEKLAIVKKNKVLFLGKNKDFIEDYISDKLKNIKIFKIAVKSSTLPNVDFPDIYKENLLLAKKVFSHVTNGEANISDLKLPFCRYEKIGKLLFDGAHNPNSLMELTKIIKQNSPIICSFTKDRNVDKMLNILSRKTDKIYLTEIPDNNRSINLENFKNLNVERIKNPVNALYKAVENNNKSDIIVTGSLYLCSYLKKYISEHKIDF